MFYVRQEERDQVNEVIVQNDGDKPPYIDYTVGVKDAENGSLVILKMSDPAHFDQGKGHLVLPHFDDDDDVDVYIKVADEITEFIKPSEVYLAKVVDIWESLNRRLTKNLSVKLLQRQEECNFFLSLNNRAERKYKSMAWATTSGDSSEFNIIDGRYVSVKDVCFHENDEVHELSIFSLSGNSVAYTEKVSSCMEYQQEQSKLGLIGRIAMRNILSSKPRGFEIDNLDRVVKTFENERRMMDYIDRRSHSTCGYRFIS